MIDAHTFLKALATVLCVAGLTTALFQKLRLPTVLGYLVAGMVVGPYIPIPRIADRQVVQMLSELGVILLMFSIGLEFSLRKLVRVGKSSGLVMVLEVGFMLWVGYLVGRLFGFSPIESIFTGAIVSISSTMMIAKTFSEQSADPQQVELVFGILVFEDLMAILILAALTALSVGSLSAATLVRTLGSLAAFLLGLLFFGILLIPRLIRLVARSGSSELLLVSCVGLCFAISLLAQAAGFSVALGAFISGSLVAESGEGKAIEHLVRPLRDLFGAIFFVSVGMMIDPALILSYWPQVLALSALVVVGKILAISVASFLTGSSIRTAIQTAMPLAQIGEFSFIIAGVGLAQGTTRSSLLPIAVAVSALTSLLTPFLMRASGPVAAAIDRRLPRRLQTFVSLYASWLERLNAQPALAHSPVRRLIKVLSIDVLCLLGVVIGDALALKRLLSLAVVRGWSSPTLVRIAVAGLALGISLPFWIGIVRSTRKLGSELAGRAIPTVPSGQLDLGAAPRQALSLTFEIVVLLLAGGPLVVAYQLILPSLAGLVGGLLWLVLLGVLGLGFWRSTNQLDGHVRAGAAAVVEALAAQAASPDGESVPSPLGAVGDLHELLAGLGSSATELILPTHACVGKTLAALNLRGLSGATVLAIGRGAKGVAVPTATQALEVGDALVLTGSARSIEQALLLLRGPRPDPANRSQATRELAANG